MVFVTTKRIGESVVSHINKNIEIGAAYGFFDDALGLTGTEAGNNSIQNIGIALVT